MDTQKINKTAKVEVQAEAPSKFDIKQDDIPTKKNHVVLFTILKILGIILAILCLARVPFVGSYLDGLFDYIFGLVKYVFYVWVIFSLVAVIYNGRLGRIVKTKRFFIFSALAFLALGCIVSGCYDLVKFFNQHPSFTEKMSNYHNAWKNYFLSTSYANYFNSFISGGILSVLLSFLFNFVSYAILVVFAVILFIICIFIIFNINYKSTRAGLKLRGWLVRKLGGSFKYDGYDELSNNHDNQNRFKKHKKEEIEEAAKYSDEVNFELLPETDINNDKLNFKKASSIQAKIANLFKREGIDCVAGDINIYTTFSEICFETKTTSDIKQIVKLQDEISKVSKLDKYNISYRGSILSIEYDNQFFSKLSLKSASALFDKAPLTSFFGVDKYKKLIKQDFSLSPSALIIGQKGSGSATLTSLMMLSICLCNKPEMLDLVILNPNAEQTYAPFYNIPHTSNKTYESINVVTDKLHDLQEIINQRASLLKMNNVSNIEQFNKITSDSTSKMKYVLVVITNVENTIRETFQNSKIIEDILVNGPNVGIFAILQSYSANAEVLDPGIYNNVSDKYILKLSDNNQSEKIFGNARGSQLHNDGDCLHWSKDKIKLMERVQVCNINKSELQTDIDVINTFYEAKQNQVQEEIVEEITDGQKII